jgi:hypothetical protein
MPLLAGSPAIDAGDSAGCAVPTDQRGVPRNQGARCDIGAFELSPSVSPLSAGARDGWVRESSERSGKGGARNAVATTLRVGDDAARRQFRSVLHFATTLPPAAIVVHAALRIRRQGQAGPVLDLVKAFGGLVVDARSPAFGSAALGLTDFQAAGALGVARFKAAPVDGWYTAEIPPAMINSTGTTQFRLRFRLDDNNNPVADYLRLFSGNAAAADRPVLVVEYYLR